MTISDDQSNAGFTIFRPTGVQHEYLVDLHNKQVTGTVLYNNEVYMTVHVDLKSDTVDVEGCSKELQGMDKETYIRMFKSEAEFFIENKISNPKEYYERYLQKDGG